MVGVGGALRRGSLFGLVVVLAAVGALAGAERAEARGCSITALKPVRSADGDRAIARVRVNCFGNSGGTLVVGLYQYRGLGYWREKRQIWFHVPRDASRVFRAGWTCASGTGLQTYETRFWAGITFKLNNGENTLVEYSDYDGPNARFRCPV